MTQPTPGFDLYRQSLHLPEDIWCWLEAEAARTGRTRSDIAIEHLRAAMTQPEETPK